ncbi:hypothetical protein LBMAG53_00060 [Planctomycetota bacterium]|nr:hypothetical protein LBMAG53_00060 [Planctomycetota bacterium]
MRSTVLIRCALGLLALAAVAGADTAGDARHLADYQRQVAPFVQQHCLSCHGPTKQKAGLRLDGPPPDLSDLAVAEHWLSAKRLVAQGDMPPTKEPRPAASDMVEFMAWIDAAAVRAAVVTRGGVGRRALRRLTREEYAATVTDLLGLTFPGAHIDLAGRLPSDTVPNAFANDSNLQTTQALQLRRSLDLAEDLLDIALPRPGTIVPLRYDIDLCALAAKAQATVAALPEDKRAKAVPQISNAAVPSALAGAKPAQLTVFGLRQPATQIDPARGVLIGSNPVITGGGVQGISVIFPSAPERGVLRLRAIAGATAEATDGAPRLRLNLAEVSYNLTGATVLYPCAEVAVTAPADAPVEYVLDIPLALINAEWSLFRRAKAYRVQLDNAAAILGPTPPPAQLAKDAKPSPPPRSLLLIRSLSLEIVAEPAWPAGSETVLAPPKTGEDESAHIRRSLIDFLGRAFRRPPREDETARYLALYQTNRSGGADLLSAYKTTIAAALIAPQTWYLMERKTAERQPLDPWELAARLSYLMTAGPPDAELRAKAADGSLKSEAELRRQVRRLTDHDRAAEFCRQFSRQWLDLDVISHLEPAFTSIRGIDQGNEIEWYERAIRADVLEEPAQTLLSALRGDVPVARLVESDQVVVNDRMARFYGIDGVRGPAWRQVPAPADRRGGLLTASSCIAAATGGKKRGEIKRGVYLARHFFGLDIPSPPGNADIKPLDIQLAEDRKLADISTRQHVERHISVPTCAVCHTRTDPLGFAWDSYDSCGRVRRTKDGVPVKADTSGRLPDSTAFADLDALRRHLAGDGSPFSETFAKRLFAYALGRGLDHGDGAYLKQIQAAAAKEGGGLRALLTAMVLSEPFRTK